MQNPLSDEEIDWLFNNGVSRCYDFSDLEHRHAVAAIETVIEDGKPIGIRFINSWGMDQPEADVPHIVE